MSQRSHIAQSGSSEMSACSAAWSAPRSFGISSSPSSSAGPGAEPDRLRLEGRPPAGSGARPRASSRRRSPCAGRRSPARSPRRDRTAARRPPRGGRGASPRSRCSCPSCTCVYQSTRAGSTTAVRVGPSSCADEVLLAEVEVDRALVHGRVGALALDQAEHRAGRRVDDRERVLVARAEREPSRRACRGPSRRSPPACARAPAARPRARTPRARAFRRRGANRPLVGGGVDVRVEDARVGGVEPSWPRPGGRAAPRARA